jgi:hypothetical protein
MNFADMTGFAGVRTEGLDEEVKRVIDELIGREEAFRTNLVSQLRALNVGLWQANGDTSLVTAADIDMQTRYIHNLLDPLLPQDAATRNYVLAQLAALDHDALNNLNWAAAGHIMDAALDMGANLINNVTDPVAAQDAVTLNYHNNNPVGFASSFSAHMTGAQVIPSGVVTIVIFDAEGFDILGEYNVATGIFTATAAGRYQLNSNVFWRILPANFDFLFYIIINNAAAGINYVRTRSAANRIDTSQTISEVLNLAVGDTVDMRVWQNSGVNRTIGVAATTYYCRFSMHRLA